MRRTDHAVPALRLRGPHPVRTGITKAPIMERTVVETDCTATALDIEEVWEHLTPVRRLKWISRCIRNKYLGRPAMDLTRKPEDLGPLPPLTAMPGLPVPAEIPWNSGLWSGVDGWKGVIHHGRLRPVEGLRHHGNKSRAGKEPGRGMGPGTAGYPRCTGQPAGGP